MQIKKKQTKESLKESIEKAESKLSAYIAIGDTKNIEITKKIIARLKSLKVK